MFNKKFLAIITALGIISFSGISVDAAAQTKRLWGSDRYKTNTAIVKDGWHQNSYYAVIVNGENFPDALSAAPLAQKYSAPILLTEDDSLNSNTADQLKRLNVKNVIIVGGQGVISPKVEKDINNLGIQTTRYKGEDRGETSINVASQIGTSNGVIVAIDDDYTDALSAAPIAASLQMPIILVSKDSFSSNLTNFILMNHIPKTYVLGDKDIISDRVASMFPNVQRITGNDKYERNINIIKTFENNINFNNVCIAYSEGFADALSGSVFASAKKNPIILMGNETKSCTESLIKEKLNSINNITILGGYAGVKDDLVSKLTNGSTNSGDNNGSILNDAEGNTWGNLRNGGFVVEKNGLVYYIKNGDKICVSKTDGTEEKRIANVKNARSLNVVDDDIYYVATSDVTTDYTDNSNSATIYKASKNGSSATYLTSMYEEVFGKGYPYMQVDGKTVLYSKNYPFITSEKANCYEDFYRLNSSTGEIKKSSDNYFTSIVVKDGMIYFTILGDNSIHKMPVSGNKNDNGDYVDKEVDLGVKGRVLDLVDGYMYYNDVDGYTCRTKEDGTEKTRLETSIPDKFIIYGDWIYYVNPGKDNLYQLRRKKLDGSQDTGLNAFRVNSFSITGNWIYYRSSGSGNLYRARLDGTSREEFPDKISIKNVPDVNIKVKKGDSCELPAAVLALMKDETNEYFAVTWDKSNIDTNTVGKYKISGILDEYGDKVNLNVEIY